MAGKEEMEGGPGSGPRKGGGKGAPKKPAAAKTPGAIGSGGMGLHVIQYPSGRHGFVGSVPKDLAIRKADGSPLSDEEFKDYKSSSNPAMTKKARGYVEPVFDSHADAQAFAAKHGHEIKNPKKSEESMKENEEKKESEEKKMEAGEKPEVNGGAEDEVEAVDGEEPAHDDKAQDAELIKSMLKKHGLIGDDEEPSEEACGIASEMMQAMKEMGYSEEETDEGFKHGMKLAKHLGSKKSAEAEEAEESEEKKESEESEESAEIKEAGLPFAPKKDKKVSEAKTLEESNKVIGQLKDEVIGLKGQLAKFQESERKAEFEKHKDTVLSKSKLPNHVTKIFLESVGDVKTIPQFDSALKVFVEGYKSKGGGSPISFAIPEKTTAAPAKTESKGSFADCITK